MKDDPLLTKTIVVPADRDTLQTRLNIRLTERRFRQGRPSGYGSVSDKILDTEIEKLERAILALGK